MHFPQLSIERKGGAKGRSFSVHFVASLDAERLAAPASNGTVRPVLLAYAGTSAAVRAFTANLRMGEVASLRERRFELRKSAGYRYQVTTPVPGRSLVVAYLPELFHLQPGVDSGDGIRFVSAPPRWWVEAQEALLRPDHGERARGYARAAAFVARLDARTPLPIAADPDFHLALYERALRAPWVMTAEGSDFRGDRLDCRGHEALGLEEPVACSVSQALFAEFLAKATAELLPRERVAHGVCEPRRAPRQLALDFRIA